MAMVKVGPYPIDVPDFFSSFDVRDADPLHAAHGIVDNRVTFDFSFVLGAGNDDERERFVTAMVATLAPKRHDTAELDVRGTKFVVHRLVLGPLWRRSVAAHYVGFAHGDLIHAAMTLPSGDDRESGLRDLIEAMINAAIVRRGNDLHS